MRTSATAPYRNDDAELLRTSAPRARGEHTVREVFIEMQQLSEFAPNQVPHTSIVNASGDLFNAGAAP